VLFASFATRFVESQRRHIIWKNNIILPLARRHFMAGDMARIGRDMVTRRYIDFPA